MMTATFYSIIPPIVMIILVLITRRVLLSLSVGIITGVLIISQYDFLQCAVNLGIVLSVILF